MKREPMRRCSLGWHPWMAGFLVVALVSSCAGPRVGESVSSRQVLLRPPRTPVPTGFTLAEAREVIAALHAESALPRARVPAFQQAGFFTDEPSAPPPEWARALWRDYQERYGTFLLSSPEELAVSRLRVALVLSVRAMPAGLAAAAWELVTDPMLYTGIVLGLTFYVAAWLAPEPVFSKGTALYITWALLGAYTVAEIRNVAAVLYRLYEESDRARSLPELEAASEHFAHAVSGTLLRMLVMIASRYVGKALPKVPEGGAGALRMGMAVTPEGMTVGGLVVDTATVMADGSLLVAGVTAGTTAAALGGGSLCAEKPGGDYKGHHIATDKNDKGTNQGGPWTPLFRPLFARANMSFDDPANMVNLKGHFGPHPEEYHTEVYDRLSRALASCKEIAACREALSTELKRLALDICNPGSRLGKLITKDQAGGG